jgi:hypothetical protein
MILSVSLIRYAQHQRYYSPQRTCDIPVIVKDPDDGSDRVIEYCPSWNQFSENRSASIYDIIHPRLADLLYGLGLGLGLGSIVTVYLSPGNIYLGIQIELS